MGVAKKPPAKAGSLLDDVMGAEPKRKRLGQFTAEELEQINEALDAIDSGEYAASINQLIEFIHVRFGKVVARSSLTEYSRARRLNREKAK